MVKFAIGERQKDGLAIKISNSNNAGSNKMFVGEKLLGKPCGINKYI